MKYFVILLFLSMLVGFAYAYEPEPVGIEVIEYGIFDKDGNVVHQLRTDQPYQINVHFESELDVPVSFTYHVQILDENKHWTEPVEEFSSSGILQPSEEKTISFEWIPKYDGKFQTLVGFGNNEDDTAIGLVPQYDFEVVSEIKPPSQQIQSGIPFDEIQCKENLVLIQKYDGSPACVTESTKTKLVERGWTGITPITKESLLERYGELPEVVAFYETYPDAEVSVRNDHVSYFSGSDDGYFVRMNLMFDENHSITDVDFHCYFQRNHQYELPQNDIAPKIVNSDCKEHGKTVNKELTFEQRCADNFKLLRSKIHDLQTSQYANATSYVTELDKALDIKKELYELKCQSRTIEWFHLISGNELSDPTQMQIQRTNGIVGEITNHMLLSPQNAVKMKIAAELEQRKIDYTIIPVTGSHTDEGWLDPARLCSTLSFDNGTEFYASAVFHPEPLEIIGIFVDLERPDDCQKYYNLPTQANFPQ